LSSNRDKITGAGEPSGLTPNINGRFTIDEAQYLSLEFVLGEKDSIAEKILVHGNAFVTELKREDSGSRKTEAD